MGTRFFPSRVLPVTLKACLGIADFGGLKQRAWWGILKLVLHKMISIFAACGVKKQRWGSPLTSLMNLKHPSRATAARNKEKYRADLNGLFSAWMLLWGMDPFDIIPLNPGLISLLLFDLFSPLSFKLTIYLYLWSQFSMLISFHLALF